MVRQFTIEQISTIIKDPSPPEGFIGVAEDHYICSIAPIKKANPAPPTPATTPEGVANDQGSFEK